MVWDTPEEFCFEVRYFILQQLKCIITKDSDITSAGFDHIGKAVIGLGPFLENEGSWVRHDWTISKKRARIGHLELEICAEIGSPEEKGAT